MLLTDELKIKELQKFHRSGSHQSLNFSCFFPAISWIAVHLEVHFFICISIAGQIATCFIFLCQYTCVYKKHLTMESTLVSTSCFDLMFSLDSEEVHPLEVPQQICLELPQLNTQYQEINVAWSSEKVCLWW